VKRIIFNRIDFLPSQIKEIFKPEYVETVHFEGGDTDIRNTSTSCGQKTVEIPMISPIPEGTQQKLTSRRRRRRRINARNGILNASPFKSELHRRRSSKIKKQEDGQTKGSERNCAYEEKRGCGSTLFVESHSRRTLFGVSVVKEGLTKIVLKVKDLLVTVRFVCVTCVNILCVLM
jgi:hypothetical protein